MVTAFTDSKVSFRGCLKAVLGHPGQTWILIFFITDALEEGFIPPESYLFLVERCWTFLRGLVGSESHHSNLFVCATS